MRILFKKKIIYLLIKPKNRLKSGLEFAERCLETAGRIIRQEAALLIHSKIFNLLACAPGWPSGYIID